MVEVQNSTGKRLGALYNSEGPTRFIKRRMSSEEIALGLLKQKKLTRTDIEELAEEKIRRKSSGTEGAFTFIDLSSRDLTGLDLSNLKIGWAYMKGSKFDHTTNFTNTRINPIFDIDKSALFDKRTKSFEGAIVLGQWTVKNGQLINLKPITESANIF